MPKTNTTKVNLQKQTAYILKTLSEAIINNKKHEKY